MVYNRSRYIASVIETYVNNGCQYINSFSPLATYKIAKTLTETTVDQPLKHVDLIQKIQPTLPKPHVHTLVSNTELLDTAIIVCAYLQKLQQALDIVVQGPVVMPVVAFTNDYVGKLGEIIHIKATLKHKLLVNGYYNKSTLLSFETNTRDILKTFVPHEFSTAVFALTEGFLYFVHGRVVKHHEYKGVKETILKNVALDTL